MHGNDYIARKQRRIECSRTKTRKRPKTTTADNHKNAVEETGNPAIENPLGPSSVTIRGRPIMSENVDFNDIEDQHTPENTGTVMESSAARKVVLLIENRPLLAEIFSHALKEAAEDLEVRIASSMEDTDLQASLAVLSFMQRSSDPLFIAFVIQQLKGRIGNLPLLVITDSADPAIDRVMEETGVQNWVTASTGFGAMVAAIRQSLGPSPRLSVQPSSQHAFLDRTMIRSMQPIPEPDPRSEIHLNLTGREIDVLALLQKGKQNKVIAHALNISESTAKVHIRNIMRKFHLRNRTEVALMCGAPTRRPVDAVLVGPDFDESHRAMPAIAY
ncbi:response regulator transcription factor [Labrys okinawensis]|uniref:helix-turn-helix transcriptional regulator n=1 Tax=Labrys okinawensis TaxID=346911 RepID=UPI0039BCCF88